MKKQYPIIVLTLCSLIFLATISRAGLINYQRRNNVLSLTAKTKAEREAIWAAWMRELPKVQNSAERRYDVNRDGVLQTAEVKIFLRDVIAEVEDKGGLLITSDILDEYDKDGDSIIERQELELIRSHVKF
jgi:hypothetical protein